MPSPIQRIAQSCLVALVARPTAVARAAEPAVRLDIDASCATTIVAALRPESLADETLDAIARLPGTERMIDKAHQFARDTTVDALKASLRSVAATGTAAVDPFVLERGRAHRSVAVSIRDLACPRPYRRLAVQQPSWLRDRISTKHSSARVETNARIASSSASSAAASTRGPTTSGRGVTSARLAANDP